MRSIVPADSGSQLFIERTDISAGGRLLLLELDRRTGREHDQAWFSWESLAERLGRSVRTIQRWAAELRRIGLLERIKDATLQSGHRLILLWRSVRPSLRPSVAPQPPTSPALVEPTSEPKRPHSPRPATAEEIDRVATKAARHLNSTLFFARGQVRDMARLTCLRWAEAAIDLGISKDCRTWAYLWTILDEWIERGSPPPSIRLEPVQRISTEERHARMAASAARPPLEIDVAWLESERL